MNKTSTFFVGIGVLVLIGVGYFVLKPTPSQEPINQNQPTSQEISVVAEAMFEYKNGQADAKVVRVEEGQKVRIKATSDVADEAHLHGYDISVDVEPGVEAVLEFTATKTGRFPVELEKLEKEIGVIEVYPK